MINIIEALAAVLVIVGIPTIALLLNEIATELRAAHGAPASSAASPRALPDEAIERRLTALESELKAVGERVQENERLQQMIRVLAAK